MFTETLDKCVALVSSLENMSYDQIITSRKFIDRAKDKYPEEPYFKVLSNMVVSIEIICLLYHSKYQ